MARIRSIHPGLWTDEDFAVLSMAARVLYLGILTEADDHGVFEWKPIALKMRIFPADGLVVEPLLSELVGARKVMRVSVDDREYGLVRNFCKFQRPKKPTFRFPLPADSELYLGLSATGSPPVPRQFGTGTENPPQMEDEGGNRSRNQEERKFTAKAVSKYVFEDGIIRLTEKDFNKWKTSFEHLDVAAELIGASKWAAEQGPDRWFPAVAGLLAKKNREAKLALEKAKSQGGFKYNGIEGVL
jgi:hypothetical protein